MDETLTYHCTFFNNKNSEMPLKEYSLLVGIPYPLQFMVLWSTFLKMIQKEVPGFAEAMRTGSVKKTPHAMISMLSWEFEADV
jgi:hypothetical protein